MLLFLMLYSKRLFLRISLMPFSRLPPRFTICLCKSFLCCSSFCLVADILSTTTVLHQREKVVKGISGYGHSIYNSSCENARTSREVSVENCAEIFRADCICSHFHPL